jgi:hypothetical protein
MRVHEILVGMFNLELNCITWIAMTSPEASTELQERQDYEIKHGNKGMRARETTI